MPVICDLCDCETTLDDAEEHENQVLCGDCYEGLDDEGEEDVEASDGLVALTHCRGRVCGRSVIKASETRDSRKGPLCPLCAHGYELERFTPADHNPETCSLCQERKKKGMK